MKKQLSEKEALRRERKKKIRRKRLVILALFLISTGIIVFAVLLKVKLFPIKSISAKGSSVYKSEEIIYASGIAEKSPIMGFSKSLVEKRITKKLPFIESVKITRNFPDAVSLKVSDANECYLFRSGKDYYTVSEKGKVLKKSVYPTDGLIEVLSKDTLLKTGEKIAFKNDKTQELFDLLSTYPKSKNITLNTINIESAVHIVINVENRFEVNLGNETNLKEKINHLAGMIAEIGDRKGKINLDVWSNSDSKGTFIEEN
ncbi:MAG: FtsQ-type POTRA domain-containing protein [Clostridia bacterium]|nr:FtsQ-type POTRA domain-containing protein [Clostridia bacterium]